MATNPDYALASDAGRTAVAALRFLRSGEMGSALALMATLHDPVEQEHFAGACLALANAALDACDALSAELAKHRPGSLAVQGDDILKVLSLAHSTGEI